MAKQPQEQRKPSKATAGKKPYAPPTLIEYGTVTKLTHGSSGGMSDGATTKACL